LDDVTKLPIDGKPNPSPPSKTSKNAVGRLAHAAFTQVRTYYRQAVFPAAFGLALLYATVLGFDGLTVSFGKAQGMGEDEIGAFRSVSSILGLLGAVSFAPAQKWIGLRRTGLLGLSVNLGRINSSIDPSTHASIFTTGSASLPLALCHFNLASGQSIRSGWILSSMDHRQLDPIATP